jgi:hypothetical protein
MKRKAMSVKQLARWIADEISPDDKGSYRLQMDREWTLDSSRGLHRRTADELATLHDRLSRAIPDDFDFTLEFEDGHVVASLDYCDGPQAGCHVPCPVALDRHLINALRKYEWNKLRATVIPGAQFYDNVADAAAAFPAEWISTSTIHEVYRHEIDSYVKWLAEVGQSSGVLAADVEDTTLMNCTVDSPDERETWISLQMGQGHLILAVVENGRLLSATETDILRRVELGKLPRIAKAKAEGRFGAALEAMGANQF